MYQLTPYSELTATYEATIASVSIQENILLVDYQNCFEESEKAAEAAAAQDEDDEEDGESSNRAQKKNSTSKVDLAGCLNRLLLEASRLEEEEERRRQLAEHQTAATTTTRKTSTSTSTVTSNLNSTASTSSSSSSLKDLYLLQSWLNASFAFQGKGGAAGGDKGVSESKKANSIHHHHHHHQSSEDYSSLLERFNLSSLAAHFDPVRRLAGNETVETFLSLSKTLIKPFFLFCADKYLYLSLRHVEQLDTILRHNFSADGVVNPVDASIDLRRGRRGVHSTIKSTAANPSHFTTTTSSSSSTFSSYKLPTTSPSSPPPLTNLKLSEFADITRIRHGAQSCEEGWKGGRENKKNNTYGAALTAVVFVITKPDDFAIRQRIRDTWGGQFSTAAPANSPIRLYFAFGREPALANESAPLPDLEALELSELRVAEEAAQHGDIVQWAFADGYYRLTIKSVAILRWASVYCPRVPALFKIDADCLLNYDALRRFSAAVARNQTATGGYYIYGNLWRGAPVLRSAKSKFYTSFLDYPQPVYPDYAGGAWYLAGPQLPLFMFRVAVLHSMPALLWEGLCALGTWEAFLL